MSSRPEFERRKRVRRMSDVRPPVPPPASPIEARLGRAATTLSRRASRRLARRLLQALEHDEFELHYQPQIDLDTGRPYGVEALVRWRRGDELVAPAHFLFAAEADGVIAPLTDRILDLAVAQAGHWRRDGVRLRLAVNLSPANLGNFDVAERLERLLGRHEVPADSITVEVTETAVLDEPEQARAVLDRIAALGACVSIDDFGTGYSSLLWLRLFPVSEVKIDRAFVTGIHEDGEAYVSGVIRLGHDLGVRVVAEGIEDERTLESLQELGCDAAQGFLFAKPMSAEQVGSWVRESVDPGWAPNRQELCVSADEPGFDRARAAIAAAAAELGYDEAAIWDLKTAATEALMNAIEHGPPSPDGLVHLQIARRNGELELEVWGGGEGGEPGAATGWRGRGIAIMNALMDEVELKRNGDDARIRLAKHRVPAGR